MATISPQNFTPSSEVSAYADGSFHCYDPDASEDLGAGLSVISGASLSGETLSITGSGFTSKVTAAPTFFEDFDGMDENDGWSEIGFDFRKTNYPAGQVTTTENFHVDTTDGFGSDNSLFYIIDGLGQSDIVQPPETGTNFHHYGIFIPDTRLVVVGFWAKKVVASGASPMSNNRSVTKGPRVGTANPNMSSDGENHYQYNPHYTTTLMAVYDGNDSAAPNDGNLPYLVVANNTIGADSDGELYQDSSWLADHRAAHGYTKLNEFDGNWHYVEVITGLNDIGQSNGMMSMQTDGDLALSVTDLDITGPSYDQSDEINYVSFHPGDGGGNRSVYTVNGARYFVESSLHQVFLGDAATLEDCSGKFVLPPTAWNGGAIDVTLKSGRPTGYDHLYVRNSLGDISDAYDIGGL